MSTLRLSNIEAKSDISSPEIDEIVNVKSSAGVVIFQVDGNLDSVYATQFTSTSDETKKKNIRKIEDPLEIVDGLDGVRFDWIKNDKPSLGLIAQNVEKVLPELVEISNDGTKSVSYGNIVGVLVEAIKSLNEENKNLRERIEIIEKKVN